MAAWQRLSQESRTLVIGVNVSARQMQKDAIVSDIAAVLATSGMEPGSLVIEITETVLSRDIETMAERLASLRSLGVGISIDDFGTGFSSLGYLQRLPINSIKIDRSFTTRILEGPEDSALAHTIVELAHGLDLKVVAEASKAPSKPTSCATGAAISGKDCSFRNHFQRPPWKTSCEVPASSSPYLGPPVQPAVEVVAD